MKNKGGCCIFSLELPGLDNQDLIKDYCYDYIEIFMTT